MKIGILIYVKGLIDTMKILKFKTGDKIPGVGFGTYKLTGSEGIKAIENALEVGYRHIDTAEGYNNQPEVSKAIKNSGLSRRELFITSKVGYDNLHYDNLIQACEETLQELKTDYLDLYLIHWPNKMISVEETLRAMGKLKSDGKIKNIGVSNFTIKRLEEVKGITDEEVVLNQVEFHPYLYQKELYEYCNDNNISLAAYSPIARGGVFGDPVIAEIGKKYYKNEAQVTLKWMIQKDIIVIPRSSNAAHIKANFDIFDFELNNDEIYRIDNIDKQERLIDPDWGEFN